jgi:hypothetical protein
MSTLKVNDIVEATSGGGKIWPSRVWVNFNGTGTIAIRADGNVSSLTDNGTGAYTVNFTNSLSDTNYATTIGTIWGGERVALSDSISSTTGSVPIEKASPSAFVDGSYLGVHVVR